MKKKQSKKASKQQYQLNSLQMLPTASQITIQLPTYLNDSSIDMVLLKHYIKAKILQKKKVSIKQPINVVIFGKDQVLNVKKIKRLVGNLDEEQEEQRNNENQNEQANKNDIVFIVNNKVQIQLTFPKLYPHILLKDIPKFYGDNSEYTNFKKIVLQNFRLHEQLNKIKLGTIKGIIIGGATGTGKSTFIKKIYYQLLNQFISYQSHKQQIYFQIISATQLLSRVQGGAEEYIRKTFKCLSKHKYSVFVIEDMHLLFSVKKIQQHETTLATLFYEMDNYEHALIVIGTYNSQRNLSNVIFQSGKFQKQIHLHLPNHHQRLQIIRSILDDLNMIKKLTDDQLKQFNIRLNGFSIGKIKQIIRDAFIMKGNQINKEILFQILKQYKPSQIKQLIVQIPEIYWNGIGGYQDVKYQIRKVTELPLKYPQKFLLLGIQPSKGILLYGPPGCSKTMMAKAIATQSKLNFIGIKGPQIYSMYVGESQRAIRNIFRKARVFSPCIIFFDQIDALATNRINHQHNDVSNRLLGQLLTEMDGIECIKQVIVIAATNRPEILDEALIRPGRFDQLIYVGPPDLGARVQIFKICLAKTPLQGNLEEICKKMGNFTECYTGAEIMLLCKEACLIALQKNIDNPVVSQECLDKALNKVKGRLTKSSIAKYQEFNAKFKSQQKFTLQSKEL